VVEAARIAPILASTVLVLIATERVSGPLKGIFQYLRHANGTRWQPLLALLRGRRSSPSDAELEAKRQGVPHVVLEQAGSFDWRLIGKVRRLAAEQGVSIVQSHGYKTHVLGFALKRLSALPWLGFEHGWTAENRRIRLYQKAAWLLRYADRAVAVSEQLQERIRRLGVRAERIVMIPNAIDGISSSDIAPGTFRRAHGIPGEVPLLGVVGRFSPEKGQRIFLEALSRLAPRCPTVHAALIGEGGDEELLRQQARAHRLDVHFPGYTPAMAEVYQDLDVVVIPSLSEGSPNVLLEAMAAARPVVATRVGGIPSVADDGVHALLVPPNDPGRLADAMASLVSNGELRQRLAVCAREHVLARCSSEARARRIFDLYGALIP
jgi:glycosyltransferase involved in cell wall biosynthesis